MIRPLFEDQPLPRDLGRNNAQTIRSVRVNLAESPLGWLKARGLVSDRQFDAGESLRRDYERAGFGARVTMRWDAPPMDGNRRGNAGAGNATLGMIDAKRRFDGAMEIAGSGLTDILWRVICAGEALPAAEKALQWPVRSGRLVLGFALDRVADFYRLS